MAKLRDIQNEKDLRNVPIHKVGVSGVSYPISLIDRENKIQHTVARLNMYVDLPHHYRGTHMSRFLEVISRHNVELSLQNLEELLDDMKNSFDCETSHIELKFPYFIDKKAPVSGISGPMEYKCRIEAKKSEKLELIVGVDVPVNNLCPCSKEISEYGAHNQRGIIKIRIKATKFVWIEELVEIAENSASAPLYTVLKREDEKFVTEQAYNNPRFVEDCAREAALILDSDDRIKWYAVEVENYESIHNHNAYACIYKS
jgi:GTP cyclohydrolase I